MAHSAWQDPFIITVQGCDQKAPSGKWSNSQCFEIPYMSLNINKSCKSCNKQKELARGPERGI